MDVAVLVRSCIEEDLPWIHGLFRRRYPSSYDLETSDNWFRNIVLKNPLTFQAARTDNAFVITSMIWLPWHPGEPEATLQALCADEDAGWQALKLVRASVEWARKRNCHLWRIGSETDYDLAPLARRVGAVPEEGRFILKLYGA